MSAPFCCLCEHAKALHRREGTHPCVIADCECGGFQPPEKARELDEAAKKLAREAMRLAQEVVS